MSKKKILIIGTIVLLCFCIAVLLVVQNSSVKEKLGFGTKETQQESFQRLHGKLWAPE